MQVSLNIVRRNPICRLGFADTGVRGPKQPQIQPNLGLQAMQEQIARVRQQMKEAREAQARC